MKNTIYRAQNKSDQLYVSDIYKRRRNQILHKSPTLDRPIAGLSSFTIIMKTSIKKTSIKKSSIKKTSISHHSPRLQSASLYYNSDCFDSADGKTRKRRKRKKNRGTPQMIVFNLDETVWPFKVDKVMTPPLNVTTVRNQVVDRVGKLFNLFPDVPKILDDLEKKFYMLGVISQSTDVEKVENLLELFDIDQYLNIHEIFPGRKARHLERISERSGIDFEDILYFDSDPTDMKEIGNLNVTTILIDKNGITIKSVFKGLHTFNVTQIENQNRSSTTLKP